MSEPAPPAGAPSSDTLPALPPAAAAGGLQRSLGLYGATLVGVAAIMGAGVFVLSGVAFRVAGPSAILAFALNGLLALVTAFSFAELAAAFPESGGSYVFARKVFPISGAFATGWVLWFAYVVAGVLYALGFSSFFAYVLEQVTTQLGHPLTIGPGLRVVGALATCLAAVAMLLRGGASAGGGVTVAKVVAFLLLVIPGLFLCAGTPAGTFHRALVPAFPFGVGGTLTAMGFTFIALEGFEVIAAVGEEVRDPGRTIPRAMFLSIGITVVIYLGLLIVLLILGGPGGPGGEPAWRELGTHGEQAVAVAAQRYLGKFGAVVVVVAGLLATFSALVSALLAASRVSYSMARDRALPRWLGGLGGRDGRTPRNAVLASAGLAAAVILLVGEVELAGAAASTIFLLSFALANGAGLLVRARVDEGFSSYRAPLYPITPLLGITGCLAIAGLQLVAAPLAALVAGGWLALGVLLYQLKLRDRAEAVSARAEALDTVLVRLRGREPLVLVPLANPTRAETLLTFADALAPRSVGRVLALAVAPHDPGKDTTPAGQAAFDRACVPMRVAAAAACRLERPFEGSILLAQDVAAAVTRVAGERRAEIVLLGMSSLEDSAGTGLLQKLIAGSGADVVVLKAPETWNHGAVRRALVPVGGEARHDALRARIVALLQRGGQTEVTLLRVIRSEEQRAEARTYLEDVADDLGLPRSSAVIELAADPAAAVIARGQAADLVVLGLGAGQGRQAEVGPFVLRIAREVSCPLVAIARRPRR